MSAFVHFLCIDLTIVDAAPGVEDVGDDKRNQDRNVSHGFQRKLEQLLARVSELCISV